MSSVCRVCLASNTTMYSLKNNQLIDVYEKLSNTKFNSEDARPRALCCNCYRKLLRCHTFSLLAYRSEQIFSNLYHKDLEAAHEYNDEAKLEINQQLSIATMPFISIDDNTTDAGSQVTIKDEPIPSIDIKEEMITDHDNLVQAESVPEHCTIRKIPLEESDKENDVVELTSNSHVEETIRDSRVKFICNSCNIVFFLKNKLISHIRNSHSQVKGEQYTENTSSAMIKDKLIHNRKKSFACEVCHKKYYTKHHLVQHTRIHTDEKPFACNECDKRFTERSYLVRHMKTHTGVKPFACTICHKQFCQNSTLVDHMRIHTGVKPFSCTVCDKQFGHRSSLINHMRIHTGVKPFSCTVCNKQFGRKSSLAYHMTIHPGEKLLACNLCDKQFNGQSHLVGHMRTHTGEKPFACNLCDKRFNQLSHLVGHMKIHTREKSFSCNVCDLQFCQKTNYISHMRIHTGEMPLSCNVPM